jgi:hypothetical protein
MNEGLRLLERASNGLERAGNGLRWAIYLIPLVVVFIFENALKTCVEISSLLFFAN